MQSSLKVKPGSMSEVTIQTTIHKVTRPHQLSQAPQTGRRHLRRGLAPRDNAAVPEIIATSNLGTNPTQTDPAKCGGESTKSLLFREHRPD